ncbi:NAD(P)/FAD-dependent oxidoreductase [Mycobacterium sp. M1]|uniref:NAD(P)/FAD-dependent oxidoreductase n=1 Tax=Mycolicibacter acidiphilus TaxID=2835306 RepID=A0ABS5RPE3_9MYCO|nr:NAD(P)/FAD-dependent oxidoreductase [Mycolicibacter acidiphilus]MBS9534799.1 NAD(P)/FAD-dependent oxidoreductase [Mycolicibacter acidiphilus]
MTADQQVKVVVIGAGFSGLCAAIQLKARGIEDFVVIEREPDVGGTWQINNYPGAQCDVPSIVYSFSFAPNPAWTRLFPLQQELQDYLRDCVDRFGVRRFIRFGREVLDCRWDEQAQRWSVRTDSGVITAQFVIGAYGPLSAPSVPDFPGLGDFTGAVFHTSRWDHTRDLTGRRVAVIGTGASAVQVIPHVQRQAGSLTVFQRTPSWVLPHPDRSVGPLLRGAWEQVPGALQASRQAMKAMFEALVPGFARAPRLLFGFRRAGLRHLKRAVPDPQLRAKLTPAYTFGCKRPTFSNTYYPALSAPNVDVVTEPIERVTADGVITAGGTRHEVDTIIMGTGFKVADNPFTARIIGRDGRSLADRWGDSDMQAYLGISVHGLPNLFLTLGPNSAPYNSLVITIEAQIRYIVDLMVQVIESGLGSVEVRSEVQDAFNDALDRRLAASVWATGGCDSYYIGNTGRIVAWWPGSAAGYYRRTRHADLADYRVRWPDPQTAPETDSVGEPAAV